MIIVHVLKEKGFVSFFIVGSSLIQLSLFPAQSTRLEPGQQKQIAETGAIASWAGEEGALEQPRTARQPSYSFCLPQPLRTSLRSVEFKTVPVSINETRTQLPEIRLHSQKARRIKRNHV